MNLENLRNNHQLLLEHMTAKGYSQNYVQQIRYNIGLLLSSPRLWESYDKILKHYTETITDKRTLMKKKAILNIIASFDCYGTIPPNKDAPVYFKHLSSYDYLNAEYKNLVDDYSSCTDRNHKKATTIRNECWNFSSFLLYLQKLGRESLTDVTESNVLSFLTDLNGYPSKSASYCGQIIAVLKKLAKTDGECQRILLYVPAMRKHKKNIQFLTEHERIKIKAVLKDTGNSLNLRDRAIGCLLYFTGLRCSDISNLKFSDIDLDKDEISISQQKTGVPLKLPLSAIVGNAVYDYVIGYRRKSDSFYIFLSETPPYDKLKAGSIGTIANQIYNAAEIRMNPADRRGGHLFRHNFATAMLENGVPRVIISKAMGQTDPHSADTYLSSDMVHLKECALSIETFPVGKGVFSVE